MYIYIYIYVCVCVVCVSNARVFFLNYFLTKNKITIGRKKENVLFTLQILFEDFVFSRI